jgi:hypothetical protein
VSRTLSYTDAVRLLGGGGNKAVATVDKLLGGLLLAVSAVSGGFVVSLFIHGRQLASLSYSLVSALDERLQGLGRFDRSERLAAAHAVIVLTAYFEALAEADRPFDSLELGFSKTEQVAVMAAGVPESARLNRLAAVLLRTELPMPAPQRSFEETLGELRRFYRSASGQLMEFVSGLAVWDRIDETRRSRFQAAVNDSVPDLAVSRYEVMFRRLASSFPEVGFWANAVDHQATREQIRQLSAGFAGLEQVVAGIASGRAPDARRIDLERVYRAALDRPILASGDVPQGLRIPALGIAYVNPDFRVAEVGAADSPELESWWARQPVCDDLQGFLLGHLTSIQATQAPLVVLGQPGSGKSVLTRVLAARLPASEFLVVRVPLRDVPADADLQAQIEYAIREATGESLTWPELARAAGDALLVVLLDGFDELLQATGTSQSDYLERIHGFQRREADLGRPVTVVVTSRTAVADRARFTAGALAIRLEPFQDMQIIRWLQMWNATNAAYFTAHGVKPLPPEVVMAHQELASQPLLLMLLALYDADHNALQRAEGQLGHAELYERLLSRFAHREVQKSSTALSDPEFEQEADRELLRLSVVALSMFNRGRQWVTEAELDTDLPLLLNDAGPRGKETGLRAPLTAAQVVLGRFFFVHEAQATRDGTRLRTCEFLHATFGEYLIARLVARELDDLADAAERNATRSRPAPPDDAFFHALLSFSPLVIRNTTISFLGELIQAMPGRRRDVLGRVLLSLFRNALDTRENTGYRDYRPIRLPGPARYAIYSANLLVLAVLAAGEVTGKQLFPEADDPILDWRAIATLWRSQLSSEGWTGLVETLAADRKWNGDRRYLRLRLAPDEDESPDIDPYWTFAFHIGPRDRHPGSSWTWSTYAHQRRKNYFLCHHSSDAPAHALDPIGTELGATIQTFADTGQDHPVSAANALIKLWLTAGLDSAPADLITAYATCLRIAMRAFSPLDTDTRDKYRAVVLRQLAVDCPRLPAYLLSTMLSDLMKDISESDFTEDDFLSQVASILDRNNPRNNDLASGTPDGS